MDDDFEDIWRELNDANDADAAVRASTRKRRRRGDVTPSTPGAGLQREAAGWALGMLAQAGGMDASSFKVRFQNLDFEALGLAIEAPKRLASARFRDQVVDHARRFWPTWTKRGGRSLTQNIKRIAPLLGLDRAEQWLLRIAVLMTQCDVLVDVLRGLVRLNRQSLPGILHAITCLGRNELRDALSPQHNRLARLGLARFDYASGYGTLLDLMHDLDTLLLDPALDPAQALRGFVRESVAATLDRRDFVHLESDTRILIPWLRQSIDTAASGRNVLIHGEPGVGKTEYARWLAQTLSATLLEVPQEDHDGDSIDGEERFERLLVCQRVAAQRRPALVLFDEVEDSLEVNPFFRRGHSKMSVNERLESNPVPTLWLCNVARGIDPAHMRRFDHVLHMRTPPRSQRLRIAREAFAQVRIPEHRLEAIAAHPELAPAHVTRMACVLAALPVEHERERVALLDHLAASRLDIGGHRWQPHRDSVPAHYRPDLINADTDLSVLIAKLCRQPQARLCLDGPPGTGKSAFARHLAQQLDRPLHHRPASDLLSRWVGESERKVARMFRDAKDDGAVLVLDEVDGFLASRERANQQWEVSLVNELLQQMEHFDGVFVATTNRLDTLDRAALRRFDYKLRFDWLQAHQQAALFADLVRDLGLDADAFSAEIRHALDRLDRLTPGDFAVVRRQALGMDTPPRADELLASLRREVMHKNDREPRPIGFTHRASAS